MALGDPYALLDDLKAYLGMQEDTRFDTVLPQVLNSVTYEIGQYCNRQFNKVTTASARTFRIPYASFVMVDDFYTEDSLVIEYSSGSGLYSTLSASDYELQPLNGVVDGEPGWPFNKIVRQSGSFIRGGRLRVTAKWGWAAVPAPVKQSCLIMGAATFQIKDAPFGVAGSDQWGSIRVKDNMMAQTKLNRFVVDRILVG
jgi:hypothetical protein